MKAIVTLFIGIYFTRAVMNALAFNRDRERNLHLRRTLEVFIQENLPSLTTQEMQEKINAIIKPK